MNINSLVSCSNKLILFRIGVSIFLGAIAACNVAADQSSNEVSPVKLSDTIQVDSTPSIDTHSISDTLVFNLSHEKPVLYPVPVILANGDSFSLKVPKEFNLSIASETRTRLRFLALSPDKRLFATDMYDKTDNRRGRVLVFENWNRKMRRFETVTVYLQNLRNPNQLAFYGNYIYVAETDKLRRFNYRDGDASPSDSGQTIARFPDYGLGYKYGGWHLTRSIAFHGNKLYVSIGSSCNACVEREDFRASVIEMNPDGSEAKIYARGLRNSVGMRWINNQLWATAMGRDLIGPDKPEDLFQRIDSGKFYGWPYYFQYKQTIYNDVQFNDSSRPAWVTKPEPALLGFKAHSAPLGFDYFKNFQHPVLNNAVLVCLHGSTSVWRQRGNAIVKVESDNRYSEIVSGFLTGKTEADRHGRPCDILMDSPTSFFFTDDQNGVLYYVYLHHSKRE